LLGDGVDRADESIGRSRTQGACGKLDDECCATVKARVLPADDAAGLARQPRDSEADERREPPFDPDAASRFVDYVEVLVEPDRDCGPQSLEEAIRNPALRLRERVCTRVVDAGEGAPAPGEIPVQVDSVRIATRSRGDAVRVEARYNPEIHACKRRT
jgi:hypothetical protein